MQISNIAHPYSKPVGEREAAPAGAVKGGEEKVELKCRVMLQKEGVDGLEDQECGKDVPDSHAGLCQWVMLPCSYMRLFLGLGIGWDSEIDYRQLQID